MQTITLPTTRDFYSIADLTGLPTNQSFIVTNNTGTQLRISQSVDKPTNNLTGFPIWPNSTALVHGNDDFPVWMKGGTDGYIIIQPLTSTVMPLVATKFAQDIVTSGVEGFRRLQVDVGQTGFFEARNFRLIRKLRQAITFKFVSTVDFILFEQVFGISTGAYEFHAWRTENVEETTSFTNDITQYMVRSNGSNEYRDYDGGRYQSNVQVLTGGTIAINDQEGYTDYAELRAANSTAQRATVGQASNTHKDIYQQGPIICNSQY